MALFKTSDHTKLHYEIDENGKNCIVFLHGLGGDLTAWEPTRKILRNKGYKTLAIDVLGQGKSDRPNKKEHYTFEMLATGVIELLTSEKITSCVLVGHCYGGVIAEYIAARKPLLVSKLILINTTYKKPFKNSFLSNTFTQGVFNASAHILPALRYKKQVHFEGYVGTSDHDIKRIASDILHTSTKSYMYLLANILKLDAKNVIQNITCPTLVISGSRDSVYPTKISKSLVELLKNGKLEVVEGENHIIVINNPGITAKLIENFI